MAWPRWVDITATSAPRIKPTVTLATLKPADNLSTLVARVGTYPKVAAG
jgi:hypothetical protein